MKTLFFLNGKKLEYLTDEMIDLYSKKLCLENDCYNGMKEMTGERKIFTSEERLQKCKMEIKRVEKKREDVLEKMKQKAINQAPQWQLIGREWMNAFQYVSWEHEVIQSITGIYCGYDIAASLEIMQSLENKEKMTSALQILKRQKHSPYGYQRVRELILNYSSKGPEFYEASKLAPLSNAEKEKIRDIRSSRMALIVPKEQPFQKTLTKK